MPAVALLAEVGAARFIARLRAAGARIVLPKEAAPGLAIALGGLGITLDRPRAALCRAGAGRGCSGPHAPSGEATNAPLRLTEPVPAWYVADILKGAPPPLNGTADRIAYKTGTSYGYRDAWAVGFDRRDDDRGLGRAAG